MSESNQVRFGTKKFEISWNSLPYHIKIFRKPDHFKTLIKNSNKKLEWNSLHMQDMQKVKLCTLCVFFSTLTKN